MLNLLNLFLRLLFFKTKLYFLQKLKELLFHRHFFLFNKFIELYNESSVSTEIKKYVFKETLDLNDELSGDSNFLIQPGRYLQHLKFFNTKLNYSQNYRRILRRRQYLRSLFFIRYKKKKLFHNDKNYLTLYNFKSLKKNYFFIDLKKIFIEKFKLIYNGKEFSSYLIFFFKFLYLLLKLLLKFAISKIFFFQNKKFKNFLFNNLDYLPDDSTYLKLRFKFFNDYIVILNIFNKERNIVFKKYSIFLNFKFKNNWFLNKNFINFFLFILNIFFYFLIKIFILINILWLFLFYLSYEFIICMNNFLIFLNMFFNFLKYILKFSNTLNIFFRNLKISKLILKFSNFFKYIYKFFFFKINLFFLIFYLNFFFFFKYIFFYFFIMKFYKKRNFAFLELLGILFSIKKDLKRRHKLLMNQKFRQKMDFRDLNLQEFVNQISKEQINNDFFSFLNLKKRKNHYLFYRSKKNLIYSEFSQHFLNKTKKKNKQLLNVVYNSYKKNLNDFLNLNFLKFYKNSLIKWYFLFKTFKGYNLHINFLLRKSSFIDIFQFSRLKMFLNFLNLEKFLKIKYLNLENKFKLKLNKNNFFINKKIISNKNFNNCFYKNKFKFIYINRSKKKIKFIYFLNNFINNLSFEKSNNLDFSKLKLFIKNKKSNKTKRIMLLKINNSKNIKKNYLSVIKRKKKNKILNFKKCFLKFNNYKIIRKRTKLNFFKFFEQSENELQQKKRFSMFLSNYGINRNISWINDLHDYTFFHKYFVMRRDKFWYGSVLRQTHTKLHDGRNILSDSWEKNFQIHQEIVYSLKDCDNSLLNLRNNYSNISISFFLKIIRESILKKFIFIAFILKLFYVFFFINFSIFIILFINLNLLFNLVLIFSIVLHFSFFPIYIYILLLLFRKNNKIYNTSLILNFKKPFIFKVNVKNLFYFILSFAYYFNFLPKFNFLNRNNLNYFLSCFGIFLNKYFSFFYQKNNKNEKFKFFIYLLIYFLAFFLFLNFFIFFDKYLYYYFSFFFFDYLKLFYLYNLFFFIFLYFLNLFFYKGFCLILFLFNIKILNKIFFYNFVFELILKLYFKNNYIIFIDFIYNLFPNNVLFNQLNINNTFEQLFILQNIKMQQYIKSFNLLRNFINK